MTILYHATLYKFTEEGSRELIELFKKESGDSDVHCSYATETDFFCIECPDLTGDQPLSLFADICERYIEEHLTSGESALDQNSIKFRRSVESQTKDFSQFTSYEIDILLGNEKEEEEDDDNNNDDDEHVLIDTKTLSIDQDDDDEIWSSTDRDTVLYQTFTSKILETVAFATRSHLTVNDERHGIAIGKTAGSNLAEVKRKLSNIERIQLYDTVIAHSFRLQEQSPDTIELRQLFELPGRLLLRTLISQTDDDLQDNLPHVLTCQIYQPENRAGLAVTEEDRGTLAAVVQRWNALSLPVISNGTSQTQALQPASLSSNHGRAQNVQVDRWLSNVPVDSPNPTDTAATEALPTRKKKSRFDLPPPSVTHEITPASGPVSVAHEENKLRSGSLARSLCSDSVPALRTTLSSRSSSTVESFSAGRSGSDQHRQRGGSFQSYSAYESSYASQSAPLRYKQTKFDEHAWERKIAREQPPTGILIEIDAAQDSTGSLLLDDTAHCQTPRAPPGISISSFEQAANVKSVIEHKDPGDLMQFDGPAELVESTNEADTRQYRRTMGQQKGRKNKGHTKPAAKATAKTTTKAVLDVPEWDPRAAVRTPEAELEPPIPTARPGSNSLGPSYARWKVKESAEVSSSSKDEALHDDLMTIFDQVRAYRGFVRIDINIGQTLVHNVQKEAKDLVDRSGHPINSFGKALKQQLDSGTISLYFNRRLTTSLVEACRIPLAGFESAPCQQEVWYEFSCKLQEDTRASEDYVLKLFGDDAEPEATRVPDVLSQVYFHYPCNVWSGLLVVHGRKQNQMPAALRKLVDSVIVEARTITRDDSTTAVCPIVKWRGGSDGLIIKDIFAKRRLSHRSEQHGELTLQVTEVQHLEIGLHTTDRTIGRAVAGLQEHMIDGHAMWYEANISVAPNPLFEQNLHLELGDMAEWQASDIVTEGFTNSIEEVTDRLISGIDAVGASNKGPRGDAKDMTNLRRMAEERELAAKGVYDGFW